MSKYTAIAAEASRVLIPLAILAAGIGGFLAFGQKSKPGVREGPDNRPALVETQSVQPFDGKIVLNLDGVAEPFRRITLSAQVDGRIAMQSPACRGGMFVAEETELVEIDPTDYALEVRRQETQLRHATEELDSVAVDVENTSELVALAEENLMLWRKELERNKTLTTSSAVTEATLDEVRRQELTGRNTLQTHKNQLAALAKKESMLQAARDIISVELEKAEEVLRRTRIVSPVEGTVVTTHVEPGDYVRKGDPIVEISQAQPIEVRCNLRIEQLYWVWLAGGSDFDHVGSEAGGAAWEIPRLPVEVAYDMDGMEVTWDGVLFRYEGTGLDSQTRTVPCRVLVEQPLVAQSPESTYGTHLPSARLFSGMYVQIRIPIDSPVTLLALPQAAVRPGNQVWIARDGKLQIETVAIAKVERDRVLVRADAAPLGAGDEVVTSPLAAVHDGMAVRTTP